MRYFDKSKTITHFEANMSPNYTVDLGETIRVETHDCYGGKVKNEDVLRADIDLTNMNQATGPFYVNDLRTTDVLKIDIKDIQLVDKGIMMVFPGLGVLGQDITESTTRLLEVSDGHMYINDRLSIQVKPMIGVIGTAPESGSVHCAVPGNHGGNMDTKDIAPGNVLYLPVFYNGGLFALGDVHASMGDGELDGTGIEIASECVLTISRVENQQLSFPVVETVTSFMFISSAETLIEAIEACARQVTNKLKQSLDIDFATAYRLLSATCDIKISQIVNKLVTVRIAVPKYVLPDLFSNES